jgi:hypothetical protein
MLRGSGAARPRMPPPGAAASQPQQQQRRTLHTSAVPRPPAAPQLPQPPLLLLDASVLVYSLRSVHEWLKRAEAAQCRLVVPTEGEWAWQQHSITAGTSTRRGLSVGLTRMARPVITTLDVLKKGTHALNVAARNATRFLEERLGGPGAQYGLVPQAAAATAGPPMSLAEADAMRMACDSSSTTLDAEAAALPSKHAGWATDGGEQDLSLRRANAAHRAVLLLALSLPDHVLAVASPPATLASTTTTPLAKVAHSHGDGGGGGGVGSGVLSEERPRWCERVDGARATRLAQAHGVQTLSCPTARSWLELDAHSPASSSSASLPPPPSKAQPPAQPRRAGDDVAAAAAAAAPDERLGRAATPVAARDRAAATTPEPASAEAQAASRPRIIFAE